MKKKYIIILGVLLILTIIVIAILLKNNTTNNASVNQTTDQQIKSVQKVEDIIENSKTVTLTSSGFSPKEITIRTGTRIIWINKSGEKASVNSDPYPRNNKWKFLNLGIFNDGDKLTLIFDKPGKYTYHNQYDSKQAGTIIVN